MNEKWVLSVRTSLPKKCVHKIDLKTEFFVFDSFEAGRDKMREIVRNYAFSKNAMFDGKGRIKAFKKCISDFLSNDELEETDDTYLSRSVVKEFQKALQEAFDGKKVCLKVIKSADDGCNASLVKKSGSLIFYGDFEGPFNGFDPYIHTNIFDMTKEKDYFLYIDDMFNDEESSSELYIDLKKASN